MKHPFMLTTLTLHLQVDPRLEGMKEPGERLATITQNLYSTCFSRVTRGMLHKDRLVFALLLTR